MTETTEAANPKRDAQDGGEEIHRWSCTIHDGEGCDGHCGPQ